VIARHGGGLFAERERDTVITLAAGTKAVVNKLQTAENDECPGRREVPQDRVHDIVVESFVFRGRKEQLLEFDSYSFR